jgi:hypothetical protein
MLYREIACFISDIHKNNGNTTCVLNVEFLNDKHDGTYSNHQALKG